VYLLENGGNFVRVGDVGLDEESTPMTRQPFLEKRFTVARPIPPAAPVMRMVLFSAIIFFL
jgi:hypothetical protein